MATVSVHQPNFMPWLRLLAKIISSDIFVAYDSVQFTRQEFHARQLLASRQGRTAWMTVPVISTGARQILRETRICNDRDWRSEHLSFMSAHYGSSPYFAEVFPVVERVYANRHLWLVDHNLELLTEFCGYLGVGVRIVRASDLPHAGDREQRLLDLVCGVGGQVHLTSTTVTHHIDWAHFRNAGIPVFVQSFEHPVYPQNHDGFVPNLGVADLLFSQGKDSARILRLRTGFEMLHQDDTAAAAVGGIRGI